MLTSLRSKGMVISCQHWNAFDTSLSLDSRSLQPLIPSLIEKVSEALLFWEEVSTACIQKGYLTEGISLPGLSYAVIPACPAVRELFIRSELNLQILSPLICMLQLRLNVRMLTLLLG